VLNVLKRGFALVKDGGGKVVQSAAAMPSEGMLSLQFHDGVRSAVIGAGGASQQKPPSASKRPRPPNPSQSDLF
jgi:exodeoxyribonuclease VII large subunit